MYTPADPKKVVIRDITLGVTYTYGLDYTISGNKVTRIAGGSLPYIPYEEYYLKEPVVVNGNPQNWRVDTVEDDYWFAGTRYMAYAEGYVTLHAKVKIRRTGEWNGEPITQLVETTVGRLIFNTPIPQDLGYVDRSVKENALKM